MFLKAIHNIEETKNRDEKYKNSVTNTNVKMTFFKYIHTIGLKGK